MQFTLFLRVFGRLSCASLHLVISLAVNIYGAPFLQLHLFLFTRSWNVEIKSCLRSDFVIFMLSDCAHFLSHSRPAALSLFFLAFQLLQVAARLLLLDACNGEQWLAAVSVLGRDQGNDNDSTIANNSSCSSSSSSSNSGSSSGSGSSSNTTSSSSSSTSSSNTTIARGGFSIPPPSAAAAATSSSSADGPPESIPPAATAVVMPARPLGQSFFFIVQR